MTTDVLLFTPGASTLKYWRLQRLRHKYLPVPWDFFLILLPLHFMLQRKRQMQSQPCLVINKGKRKAFAVQREAIQLPSQSSSFPGMWCLRCMHFPNTSVRHQSTPRPHCEKAAHLPANVTELVSPKTCKIYKALSLFQSSFST